MKNNYYILLIILPILFLSSCCKITKNIINTSVVNQGVYLTNTDVNNICIGMSKQQIISIIGTATIIDHINNIWYYISFNEIEHNKCIIKKLILIFNNNDNLIKFTIIN